MAESTQLIDAIGNLPTVQQMSQSDKITVIINQKGRQITARDMAGVLGSVISNDDRFYIQWKTTDVTKTITYGGNTALIEYFRDWVERGARPNEIKKDGTDFAYLRNSEGVESNVNWLKRADGTDSHYASDDAADYLQQVEIPSINLKYVKNDPAGYERVYFNLDSENCPSDMFPLFKDGYKDMPRYDMTFNADGQTANSCAGESQPEGVWSANLIFSMGKATNANMRFVTAWEITAFGWIQAAYYGTFNMQTALASGLSTESEAAARNFINGATDSLSAACGAISGGAFRFMYMENFCWGKQYLWGAGWYQTAAGKYRMTLDDAKAAEAVSISAANAEITGEYMTVAESGWKYGLAVDFFSGAALDNGASTSTGFCDGTYAYNAAGSIFYAGGHSGGGTDCGPFCRRLPYGASSAIWTLRGRCSLKR